MNRYTRTQARTGLSREVIRYVPAQRELSEANIAHRALQQVARASRRRRTAR